MGNDVATMLDAVSAAYGRPGGLKVWQGELPEAGEHPLPYGIARMAGYQVVPWTPGGGWVEGTARLEPISRDEAATLLAFIAVDSMAHPKFRPAPPDLLGAIADGLDALGPSTSFFSSGDWCRLERIFRASNGSVIAWDSSGISEATFDTGVIAHNGQSAFIIWAEEED